MALTDSQIRDRLMDVDDSPEVTLDGWENRFVEAICYRYGGRLSARQRKSGLLIIERYGRVSRVTSEGEHAAEESKQEESKT